MLCDPFGSSCFRSTMDNASLWVKCDCLPDCNSVRYSVAINNRYIDSQEVCKPDGTNAELEENFDDDVNTLLRLGEIRVWSFSIKKLNDFAVCRNCE